MPMYTVKEVAKLMKVSENQVYSNVGKWGGRVIPGTSTIRFFAKSDEELIVNIITGNSEIVKPEPKEAKRTKTKQPKRKSNRRRRVRKKENPDMYRHLHPTS